MLIQSITRLALALVLALSLSATLAMAAPPVVASITNQLTWDGVDGQLSMQLGSSPRSLTNPLTADDFYLGASVRDPWNVREVRVLMIASLAAPASQFRLRIFSDLGRTGPASNARPGNVLCSLTGATQVIDRGPVLPGYRLYEVGFNLPLGACTLTPSRWYWAAVDHIGVTSGLFYLATHTRSTGINGMPTRYNANYPLALWQLPLFGASDSAIYIRATRPLLVLLP